MEFHQRIIDERREILSNNNNTKDSSTDGGYSIFIDHILNNPGMFTDEEIRDHVITVLSAGELKIKFYSWPMHAFEFVVVVVRKRF
jgi:cytochrome P450